MMKKYFKIILLLFFNLFLLAKESHSENNNNQHITAALRMIGHQVLIHAGDSTSLVLPIEEKNGRYQIEFGTEFILDPENLVITVDSIIEKTKIAGSYIVEIEECETDKIVYNYKVESLKNTDEIPCKTRPLPKGCYTIYVSILKGYDLVKSMYPITSETTDHLSSGNDHTLDPMILYFIIIGFLILGTFFILKTKRSKQKKGSNMISIGKYRFDKKNAKLIFEEQRIELTGKEADLLLFLHKTVNVTVDRDDILKEVWGDEGDYIGRTLDVFISKLRKKLELDTSIKIINVRGVGYKLVIGDEEE